ncbi:hypothetical protein SNL152K_3940 [Streptomyces sp. NL15-2K]|nr:hypothetical protein SNL152K_3940 [Streptomyces sp. NL15-2K]
MMPHTEQQRPGPGPPAPRPLSGRRSVSGVAHTLTSRHAR